jgi:mRNA-degrading endonuclease YafQ of YafQ-DinJ toxin-antitoxin module
MKKINSSKLIKEDVKEILINYINEFHAEYKYHRHKMFGSYIHIYVMHAKTEEIIEFTGFPEKDPEDFYIKLAFTDYVIYSIKYFKNRVVHGILY